MFVNSSICQLFGWEPQGCSEIYGGYRLNRNFIDGPVRLCDEVWDTDGWKMREHHHESFTALLSRARIYIQEAGNPKRLNTTSPSGKSNRSKGNIHQGKCLQLKTGTHFVVKIHHLATSHCAIESSTAVHAMPTLGTTSASNHSIGDVEHFRVCLHWHHQGQVARGLSTPIPSYSFGAETGVAVIWDHQKAQ